MNLRRLSHLAAGYTLLLVSLATPALAASKLENVANSILTLVKILVLCVFGWKAAEAAFKERYSAAWVLFILGALVGGFLFVGEPVFRWLWTTFQNIADGV